MNMTKAHALDTVIESAVTTFLHIGTPKTGTTYAQLMLTRHRDELEDAGLRLGHAGLVDPLIYGNGGNKIGPSICHHPLLWSIMAQSPHPDIFVPSLSEIGDELDKDRKSGSNILYTSELFYWGPTCVSKVKQIRDFFEPDTFVLISLRNRWSFLDSMYLQAVSDHGEKAGPGQFLEYYLDKFNYDLMLSWWEAAFGVGRVKILNYDKGSDPFDAILAACGISLNISKFNIEAVNGSVTPIMAEALRQCNEQNIDVAELVSVAKYSQYGQRRYRVIDDQIIDSVESRFSSHDDRFMTLNPELSHLLSSEAYRDITPVSEATYKEMSRLISLAAGAIIKKSVLF